MGDYRDEYKTIKVPISEEDIRLFQDLVDGKINHFAWTFDKTNLLFSKKGGEDEWSYVWFTIYNERGLLYSVNNNVMVC